MSAPTKLVGEIQHAYGITKNPLEHTDLASATGLMPLLAGLDVYTTELEIAYSDNAAAGLADEGVGERIKGWRLRLDWYRAIAETTQPDNDPSAILWQVTAPLFMGHYYGPEGDEGVRPPDGWTTILGERLPPVDGAAEDLRAPFILMTEVDAHGSVRAPSLMKAFSDAAEEAPSVVGATIGAALAAAVEAGLKGLEVAGIKGWHLAVGAGVLFTGWLVLRR